MPSIAMPGPIEWVIILLFLLAALFGVGLAVRLLRKPREPRGFDVEPRRRDPQ
jgi:hypothetical protein